MRVNLSVAIVSMVNQTAIPHTEDNDTSDVCPKTKPINGTFVPVNLLFLSSSYLNHCFSYLITLYINHITSHIVLLFKSFALLVIASFRYWLSCDISHLHLS